MSERNLSCRVREQFFRKVKISCSQKDVSLHDAIVISLCIFLNIDSTPETVKNTEELERILRTIKEENQIEQTLSASSNS